MSALTPTTNLGLFKANPGTAEPFRPTDMNSNWDKVDAAIGAPYADVIPATVASTVSETAVIATLIGPAQQGSIWELEANGTFGHAAVATTLAFKARIGGVSASWTINTPASALSGRFWRLNAKLFCLTTGVSGTWKLSGLGVATVNATDTPGLLSATVTRDTTIQSTFDLTVTWGAASASNTLTCDAGYIKRLTNS